MTNRGLTDGTSKHAKDTVKVIIRPQARFHALSNLSFQLTSCILTPLILQLHQDLQCFCADQLFSVIYPFDIFAFQLSTLTLCQCSKMKLEKNILPQQWAWLQIKVNIKRVKNTTVQSLYTTLLTLSSTFCFHIYFSLTSSNSS